MLQRLWKESKSHIFGALRGLLEQIHWERLNIAHVF